MQRSDYLYQNTPICIFVNILVIHLMIHRVLNRAKQKLYPLFLLNHLVLLLHIKLKELHHSRYLQNQILRMAFTNQDIGIILLCKDVLLQQDFRIHPFTLLQFSLYASFLPRPTKLNLLITQTYIDKKMVPFLYVFICKS